MKFKQLGMWESFLHHGEFHSLAPVSVQEDPDSESQLYSLREVKSRPPKTMYPRPISYAVITNLKRTQADSAGGLVRNGNFSHPNPGCLYCGPSATNSLVGKITQIISGVTLA